MLTVDEKNGITLTRGDSAELEVVIKDANGDTYDYSNDTVKFGVKRTAFESACVLEKTVEDGKIVLTPEDTKTMEYGDYLYDIQVAVTGEDESVSIYTPIAAARFSLGYEVL